MNYKTPYILAAVLAVVIPIIGMSQTVSPSPSVSVPSSIGYGTSTYCLFAYAPTDTMCKTPIDGYYYFNGVEYHLGLAITKDLMLGTTPVRIGGNFVVRFTYAANGDPSGVTVVYAGVLHTATVPQALQLLADLNELHI